MSWVKKKRQIRYIILNHKFQKVKNILANLYNKILQTKLIIIFHSTKHYKNQQI